MRAARPPIYILAVGGGAAGGVLARALRSMMETRIDGVVRRLSPKHLLLF